MTKPTQSPDPNRPSLLEFPCRFPVKAMGRSSDRFIELVQGIVLRHAELWPGEDWVVTPSRAGNFVSVTGVIEARSQEQLDSIYQALSDSELVLMAL